MALRSDTFTLWLHCVYFTFLVKVSPYDMSNTYLPAWEALVKKGKALGIMVSAFCDCS